MKKRDKLITEPFYREFSAAAFKFFPTGAFWLGSLIMLAILEKLSAPPNPWDRFILNLAQDIRFYWLDRFFALVTWSGSLYVLVPVTAFIFAMLAGQGRNGEGWLLALSLTGATVLSQLGKLWFARPRPDLFPPLGEMPFDHSYPSAHTAQIVAFTLALWWIFRPENPISSYFLSMTLAVILALLVGLSRVYLQVHYPSDVVGGALVSIFWCKGLYHLLQSLDLSVS